MRKILFATFSLILCLAPMAVNAATITPAFGKWSSAGMSVDAAKQNINTMQVVGASGATAAFTKPAGKPTLTIGTDSTVVKTSGNQTIAGVKTFGSAIVSPNTPPNRYFIGVGGFANLSTAKTSIGSTPATLEYSADVTLSNNIAFPATLELIPLNGAKINHGTHTISYAGSTARWPSAQVFNGTGLVSGIKDASPEWWNPLAAGTSDDTPAWAAMLAGGPKRVKCLSSSYIVGNLTPLSGVVIDLNGATLNYKTGATGAMLSAITKTDILIQNGVLDGGTVHTYITADAAPALDRTGLLVQTSSLRIRMKNVTVQHFANAGVSVNNVGNTPNHGKAFHATNCVFDNNYINVLHGTRGEYSYYTGCESINARVGVQIGCGNVSWTGGGITDNVDGVSLVAGVNDGHGTMTGALINHNTDYAIRSDGVLNGFTFNGCHLYGGSIYLKNSTGVQIINGHLSDNAIYAEGGGYNLIAKNFVNGTLGAVQHGFGATVSKLQLSGNYNSTGGDGNNNPAVFVQMTAMTAATGITSDTIIKYATPLYSQLFSVTDATLYDVATGIGVMPIPKRLVSIEARFEVAIPGGAAAKAGGYLSIGGVGYALSAQDMKAASTGNTVTLQYTGMVELNSAISVKAFSSVSANVSAAGASLIIQTLD